MPLHKTEEDELNEATVAATLEERFDGWLVTLADLEIKNAAYDLIVTCRTSSKTLAYIEVKRRHINTADYPTALAGKGKTDKLIDSCRQANAVPIYIFWYDDGLRWIDARTCAEGDERPVVRTKPRLSGLWSRSDWGHAGYYFDSSLLKPLSSLSEHVERKESQWSSPESSSGTPSTAPSATLTPPPINPTAST